MTLVAMTLVAMTLVAMTVIEGRERKTKALIVELSSFLRPSTNRCSTCQLNAGG